MTPLSTPTALAFRGDERPRLLDLFSGIGGFSLGLERAGFETVAFCEIDPFCRRVLAKHWPEVPCYDDVRTLTAERLAADGAGPIDAICGGFPCQDLSFAGKGAGLAGERSGLYREIIRLAGELRPVVIILENVSALLSRGLGNVLGDLAALGYDAEWHCIPASYVGAHHRRDRIWVVAHLQTFAQHPHANRSGSHRTDLDVIGGSELRDQQVGVIESMGGDVAHTERWGPQGRDEQRARPTAIFAPEIRRHRRGGQLGATWRTEPNVGRVAHGVPDAVDRLSGLGNAVVPQIPEILGRAILAARAASQQTAA